MHPFERRVLLNASTLPRAAERSLLEDIERWTKLAVGAIGILYVLGFLVHTLYLAGYGVSAMSLLRVQYIMAGLWALLPPALVVGGVVWVMYEIESERDYATRFKTKRQKVWPVVAGLITLCGLVGFATDPAGVIFSLPPNVRVLDVFNTLVVMLLLVGMTAITAYGKWKATVRSPTHFAAGTILVALFLIAYLARFAHTIYPGIPAGLGGGQPANARLSISNEAKESVPIDGAHFYPLLVTTERAFTLVVENHAVEVSRDVVNAVTYETPKRY